MDAKWWQIRYAKIDDIPSLERIARQYSKELPFISRVQFAQSIGKQECFVAENTKGILGFVRFHTRRDGWSTIYDLAVGLSATNQGVGRALLYAVPAPMRLKCTQDNSANRFYINAGMQFAGIDAGKNRPLNIYEMRILSILVHGSNEAMPAIARASHMAYGTRHDMKPFDWPFMVDIRWDNYDWQDYIHKICIWHPVQAMCADYEHPSQRRELYRQIRDLRAAGVLRIKVCPKFNGATEHIPSWCIGAFSVPSQYAGFIPSDLREFSVRRWHLLGGTPQDQIKWITRIGGLGGQVISIDGNSHESAAKKGSHFESGRWQRKEGQAADYHHTITISGQNIVKEVNAAAQFNQLSLFDVL